jgi:uracil-DNA glycosylase
MEKNNQNIEASLQELWAIIDSAEMLVKGKNNRKETGEIEVPDFSAIAAMLSPAAEVGKDSVSAQELESAQELGSVQSAVVPELEQLPVHVDSCRNLAELAWKIADCKRCRLCEGRKKPVPGAGVMNPKVLIIGEAPGAEEDKVGEPFIGKSGKYLDTWMGAIKLFRGRDLFIANIIKCRPPENRDPFPDEQQACIPYLKKQIRILKPQSILCTGRVASQIMTGRTEPLGLLRKQIYEYEGIPMVVTYHPSGVLRNPEYRAPVWEDLKKLASFVN